MAIRHIVSFTPEEREMLTALTSKGAGERRSTLLGRAPMLSEPEPEGPGWTSSHINEALVMSGRAIERAKNA